MVPVTGAVIKIKDMEVQDLQELLRFDEYVYFQY
jgi:hypothetical protein